MVLGTNALDKSNNANILTCISLIFKDCKVLLDKLCKKYPPSTIIKSYLLTNSKSKPTKITTKLAASYKKALVIELSKDTRKDPAQINLLIL